MFYTDTCKQAEQVCTGYKDKLKLPLVGLRLTYIFQSSASCKAVEERAKEIASSLDAEYWSVSSKTGRFNISA